MAGPLTPPVGTRFSGSDIWLLDGPTSAPAGTVTVIPGSDVNAVTVANPAGTRFYLLSGTHVIGGSTASQFDSIIPKAGNTYVGAPGAVLSGRGVNNVAFSGSAANVTVQYLEVTGFMCGLNEFVVNHDTAVGWTIQYCNIHGNKGAGVGVGTDSVVSYCWLHDNQQYGFSSYSPALPSKANAVTDVTVDHCEINSNGTLSLEYNPDGTPTGAGLSGAGKFWDTLGITVTNNWIHDSVFVGVWCDTNNVGTRIEGNLFENNNAEALFYELSYNLLVANNTFRGNAIQKGKNFAGRSDNFPIAAIYLSESGGDSAVSSTYPVSLIENNTFVDNWGDITLWENSDRFFPAGDTYHAYWPKGHGANPADCNDPTTKVLTCSTTSGSEVVNITTGVIASTDEGRPVSGTGIPTGTKLRIPDFPGDPVGFNSSTQFRMDHAATATATGVTVTIAAGSINVDPAYTAARWHTQNNHINDNTFSHDPTVVLGGFTLPSGVVTGKVAVISQYGTYPSWSPYHGTIIQDAITFNNNNLWSNNAYAGPYTFMPHDTGLSKTFTQWQTSPYNQDAGSTFTSTPSPPSAPQPGLVVWVNGNGTPARTVGIHAMTVTGLVPVARRAGS